MSPELLFNIGAGVCIISAIGAVAVIIVLRVYKTRLNKKLDAEYGKRRR